MENCLPECFARDLGPIEHAEDCPNHPKNFKHPYTAEKKFKLRIYEGTAQPEEMDEITGQFDQWMIGYRGNKDFFQIQGDSLWSVIRGTWRNYRYLKKKRRGEIAN